MHVAGSRLVWQIVFAVPVGMPEGRLPLEIVDAVGKLYALPPGIDPTVATIVDVDALRKTNTFYAKAENGDTLVVTADRAILYDPKKKIILDVVPVQIQPQGANRSSAVDTPAKSGG